MVYCAGEAICRGPEKFFRNYFGESVAFYLVTFFIWVARVESA